MPEPEPDQEAGPASMTGAFLLGLLFAFVGTVLLGIAAWRSHLLAALGRGTLGGRRRGVPRPGRVVLGQATTGSSLPTRADGAPAHGSRLWMDRLERIPAGYGST